MWQAWWIGQADDPPLDAAREALRAWANVVTHRDLAAALAAPRHAFPELVFLAQQYPGQHAPADGLALQQAFPLARLVRVVGSLCEGEGRSGPPWPGVPRIAWHQMGPWARRELASRGALCRLPATASEEERLLGVDVQLPRRSGTVVLQAGTPAMADWLAESVGMAGYAVVEAEDAGLLRGRGVALGVWEGADLRTPEPRRLRRFVQAVAPAPVIVLVDFLRWEDDQLARTAGARRVLSKPVLLADLLAEVAALGSQPHPLPPAHPST